jgi:hypothetical protein
MKMFNLLELIGTGLMTLRKLRNLSKLLIKVILIFFTSQLCFSQNTNSDDWNGFDEGAKSVSKSSSMKKTKTPAVVDDFNSLDVKSKVEVKAKPVKTQKEEDEFWEMLNS